MVERLALLLLFGGVAGAQLRTTSARAGSVHLLQGIANIDGKPVEMFRDAPPVQMSNGQCLHVEWGRLELQLGPGAALALSEGSTLRLLENRLNDVRVELEEGSALVAVDRIYKGDRIRVMYPGGAAELRAGGWYRFDAAPQRLRVYRGSAEIDLGDFVIPARKGQQVDLSRGWEVSWFNLKDPDPLLAWEQELAEIRNPPVRLAVPFR